MDNTASLIINIVLIVLGCILLILSSLMIDRFKKTDKLLGYEEAVGLGAAVLVFSIAQIIIAIIQLAGKMMELIWDIAMGILFIVYLVVFSLAVDWNFHKLSYNNDRSLGKSFVAFTAISWIFIFFVLLYVIILKLRR